MAWDPTQPVTGAALTSAPMRGNFAALDTAVMAPVIAAATGALFSAGADVLVPLSAVATGAVLASAGVNTAPTWNTAPSLTGLTLSGLTPGSVLFAGASGVLSQDNANLFYDNASDNLRLGASAVGTSGQKVLALGPGTAPTTSPVDTVQLAAVDFAGEAGSRAIWVRDERGGQLMCGSRADTYTYLRLTTPTGQSIELDVGPGGADLGSFEAAENLNLTAGLTSLALRADGGIALIGLGSATFRALSTGAVDSGGTGYRMLRIANA